MGVSVFPAGSAPTGHVHDGQEETIYCAAGRGRIVTPEATAEIEAGVTVWISVGTFHATESDGPEPLELVCFFSPPVAPGSYESAAIVMLTDGRRTTGIDTLEAAGFTRVNRHIESRALSILGEYQAVKPG